MNIMNDSPKLVNLVVWLVYYNCAFIFIQFGYYFPKDMFYIMV